MKNVPIKIYSNIIKDKYLIYKENNRAGIYRFNNKITKESYIGQSKNLKNRFYTYFSLPSINTYLKTKNSLIYSDIIKYGHENFSLDILKYCEYHKLKNEELNFINLFKPKYNNKY